MNITESELSRDGDHQEIILFLKDIGLVKK